MAGSCRSISAAPAKSFQPPWKTRVGELPDCIGEGTQGIFPIDVHLHFLAVAMWVTEKGNTQVQYSQRISGMWNKKTLVNEHS